MKDKIWNYEDWSTPYQLPKLLAKVTSLVIIGSVTNLNDLKKFFVRIRSTRDFVDYSQHFKITQIEGGLIQIESDFVSEHTTKMLIEMPATQIFSSITKGYLKFQLSEL